MFGIGYGPSGSEKSQYNNLTAASGFATGLGESDLTASSNFMQDVLSGDPTKVAKALAPEISASQKQTQQEKNQLAEFAPRTGGTAATAANADTASKSNIINLIGGLQNSAASGLASTGSNLLSTGVSGDIAGFGEAKTMQDQNAAKWNDIIQSIAAAAGATAGFPGVSKGVSQGLSSFAGAFGV
jgi:hypothetical protein